MKFKTVSGHEFYIGSMQPEDVRINDLCWALAHVCRYAGHVVHGPYSVAEHSIHVASLLPPELRLAGLLHDAAEAYLGDVPSPVKELLPDYKALELRVQKVIHKRFGIELTPAQEQMISAVDALVCEMEMNAEEIPDIAYGRDCATCFRIVLDALLVDQKEGAKV